MDNIIELINEWKDYCNNEGLIYLDKKPKTFLHYYILVTNNKIFHHKEYTTLNFINVEINRECDSRYLKDCYDKFIERNELVWKD